MCVCSLFEFTCFFVYFFVFFYVIARFFVCIFMSVSINTQAPQWVFVYLLPLFQRTPIANGKDYSKLIKRSIIDRMSKKMAEYWAKDPKRTGSIPGHSTAKHLLFVIFAFIIIFIFFLIFVF